MGYTTRWIMAGAFLLAGCNARLHQPRASVVVTPPAKGSPGVTSPTTLPGLIFNFDAAVANGTGFPGAGLGYPNWRDVGSFGLLGVFLNFTAGYGWSGTGIPSDPYQLKFDGYDDLVRAVSGSFDTTNSTVVSWFKLSTAMGYANLLESMAADDITENLHFSLYLYDGYLMASVDTAGAGDCTAPTPVTNGTWTFGASTYDGTTLRIYQGGSLRVACTQTVADPTPTALIYVGASTSITGCLGNSTANCSIPGSIASAQVYDRPLTASEILQLCQAQVGNFQGANCN